METLFSSQQVAEDAISTRIGSMSEKLMAQSMFLGTAESCTGGLVAALCTEVAGSSNWFAGSVVAYANEVKQHMLGVPRAVLDEHGAVSGETVAEMVHGLIERLGVDVGIAISGIAGPGGGTPEKPVGTVWVAVGRRVGNEVEVEAHPYRFQGNRRDIRLMAAYTAFSLVDEMLTTLN